MSMKKKEIVYAFIDANNLHLGTTKGLGWEVDYKKFMIWLEDKANVSDAYMFIGKIEEHEIIAISKNVALSFSLSL